MSREDRQGYVYFIMATRSETELTANLVKIGYSLHPGWRVGELQTGCPYPLKLIQAFPGTQLQEKRLHRYFAKHNVYGEWYDLVPEILEVIQSKKLPFIEHEGVILSKTDDGEEVFFLRAAFKDEADLPLHSSFSVSDMKRSFGRNPTRFSRGRMSKLLRTLLSDADSREITVAAWIEEAIKEKLERK